MDKNLRDFLKKKDALLLRRSELEKEISTIDGALNGAHRPITHRKKSGGKRGAVAEAVRAFLKKKGGATYGEVTAHFGGGEKGDRHARALGSMFSKKKLKRKGDKYVLLEAK